MDIYYKTNRPQQEDKAHDKRRKFAEHHELSASKENKPISPKSQSFKLTSSAYKNKKNE